jgi:hypothetical protein
VSTWELLVNHRIAATTKLLTPTGERDQFTSYIKSFSGGDDLIFGQWLSHGSRRGSDGTHLFFVSWSFGHDRAGMDTSHDLLYQAVHPSLLGGGKCPVGGDTSARACGPGLKDPTLEQSQHLNRRPEVGSEVPQPLDPTGDSTRDPLEVGARDRREHVDGLR